MSLLLFVLSPRFGKLASGTGPRLPMAIGPIVAGVGLLLLTRVGADPDYVTDILPGPASSSASASRRRWLR